MKKINKFLAFIFCLVFSFSLVSCNIDNSSKGIQQTSEKNKTVQKDFDKFLSNLFIDNVTSDSITLHYTLKDPTKYGITKLTPTLGQLTDAEFKKDEKETNNTLKKLKTFNYSQLTQKQQTTYKVVKDYYETEKKSNGLSYYSTVISPTIGLQAQLPTILAEYNFYSKDDVTTYIALLNLVDDYFNQIIDFEKKKSKDGLFMADFAVNDIVDQCNEFIKNTDNNYLITTFNNKIDQISGLTDDEKNAFKESNKTAVLNCIIPSYQKLITELTSLKGKGTNKGGLCNFPSGKKYYEYLFESQTGSDSTVNEMKSTLETRLKKKYLELHSIITTSPDVLSVFGSKGSDITDPSQILAKLKEEITKYYPKAPNTSYEVKYVDKSLEDNLSPAFYMTPPIDDYNSNVVYINNSQVDAVSLFPTLAHEGYPGHLYQVTYYNSTKPNPIRQVLNFGGYTEGWATYVENQSYELEGLNNDALVKLSQVYSEISLALPTIIDIGVNYDGWTLKDTEKFISSYGFNSSAAEKIYHSVIEEPGNYLQYYVGYLQFSQLKDYASKKLGNKFNIINFNKALLDVGPAPFSVVKEQVDKYITNAK